MGKRAMPLSSAQGQKEDVQDCLTKFAGGSNLCFLCPSTFSSWSRLPTGRKNCLGRLSHSTITNLFWWVREDWWNRVAPFSQDMSVALAISQGGDAFGKDLFKGWCRWQWIPCTALGIYNLSLFFSTESAPGQATWAAVPSGWAECVPSGIHGIWDRKNDVGNVTISL